jgi:solute carrier family 45, member 1/2/4
MIPPIADGDPDPTTQIPWPSGRSRNTTEGLDSAADVVADDGMLQNAPETNGKANTTPTRRRLTTWDLFTLSVSMAGAQIAWTVELGYVYFHYGYPSDLDRLVMGRHFSLASDSRNILPLLSG